jgi:CRP-like cAMP-binding protein
LKKTFKKGNIIVRQGDNKNKNLYILRKGRCSITRTANNCILDCGKIYPGDIFGELSMILGLERSATILAIDDEVEVEELNKITFQEIIKKEPEIAWTVLTKLAIKTQMLDEIRGEMMHPDVIRTLIENKKKGL